MNRIKEVLFEKGISQTWLAKKLGVDFKTVNAYVTNKYQPSLIRLLQIATILEIDIKELLK